MAEMTALAAFFESLSDEQFAAFDALVKDEHIHVGGLRRITSADDIAREAIADLEYRMARDRRVKPNG